MHIVENALCHLTLLTATTLILFLTMPVTVTTAKRSLSKLKIIKNYFRNLIGQTRLSELPLLATQASSAMSMDIDELI